MRKPAVAVLLLVLAFVLAGCGQEAAQEAEPKPDPAAELREKVWSSLEGFAGTSWYGYIKDLSVKLPSSNRAEFRLVTSLTQAGGVADQICRIVWGNYYNMVGRDDLHVFVTNEKGGTLAYCGI